MFERLFGRNDDDEEGRADQRRDGGQPPGDPAAPGQPGQPGQTGDLMAGEGDGEGADDGPDVGELDVRLGELEEDVDSLESSLRAVRSSQEEFADSIEEMNERVRRLVGVYDRLNAAENPFVDDATDPDAVTADGGESAGSPGDGTTAGGTGSDGQDADVVSFDDLEHHRDGEGDAGHPDNAGAGDEPSDDKEGSAGVDADRGRDRNGDQAPSGRQEPSPPVEPERAAAAASEQGPVLESVPDSYAGEVLVMEWLSVLMEGSGPADALRAVGHYEDAGWISREVRDHLVDVIGGPTLDVHVDPTQSRESTADEHAISYRYLSVLTQLDDV